MDDLMAPFDHFLSKAPEPNSRYMRKVGVSMVYKDQLHATPSLMRDSVIRRKKCVRHCSRINGCQTVHPKPSSPFCTRSRALCHHLLIQNGLFVNEAEANVSRTIPNRRLDLNHKS